MDASCVNYFIPDSWEVDSISLEFPRVMGVSLILTSPWITPDYASEMTQTGASHPLDTGFNHMANDSANYVYVTVGGTVKPLWKTAWRCLQKLKIELLSDPAIPFLSTYPKEMKTGY